MGRHGESDALAHALVALTLESLRTAVQLVSAAGRLQQTVVEAQNNANLEYSE